MAYPKTGLYAALLCAGLLAPALTTAVSPVMTVGAQSASVTTPALMLASEWHPGHDPSGFLVSEKLDGVRAFWDGHSLRFRSGRLIAAPAWFIAALPSTALDGELWLGRHQFDRLSATVRRSVPNDDEWHALRYMVFDLPGAPGPFVDRAKRLADLVQQAGQPWLQAVAQQTSASAVALQSQLKQLAADGGEGLVLHRADALWLPGRSQVLLKYKLQPDEEARVVGHLPGKGRNAGRLGALLLELPDGQRFALGSGFTDAQRAAPPPLGALVSYRYRDHTSKGLPRFATFLRLREADE